MSEITLRRMDTRDCLDEVGLLLNYAFRPSPPLELLQGDNRDSWTRITEGTETFLLTDGATPIGSASTLPMTHNVRGALVPSWGVWGVTCEPAYRRSGVARRAMSALLAGAYQSEIPYSTLYAFRDSFYERMGYVSWPQPRRALMHPADMGPLLRMELPGTIERMLIADGWDDFRAYMRRVRNRTHGMGIFNTTSTFWREYNRYWLALARVEGEVRGLMVYRLEGSEDNITMNVPAFYADDLTTRGLLLNWIARHVDQVAEVKVLLPAFERPDLWWSDLKVRFREAHSPMGRIVDVMRIGGMVTGPGAFSAHIDDDFCDWNTGNFLFESVNGALAVTRLGDSAPVDCTLTIQGLGGLVFGTHEPDLIAFRSWGDPAPELRTALRIMFPPQVPHLHEVF